MKRSEQIGELAAALAKAQAAITGAGKDKFNPGFKSMYATLDSVWDACRGPLTSNGLSVMQGMDGDRFVSLLAHSSGQWVESSYTVVLPADPQKMVAAITYLRRCYLSAITGVAPTDDDDGNSAAADHRESQPAQPHRQPPPAHTSSRQEHRAPQGPTPPTTTVAGRTVYSDDPEVRVQQYLERVRGFQAAPAIRSWEEAHMADLVELPDHLGAQVKAAVEAQIRKVGQYVPVGQR